MFLKRFKTDNRTNEEKAAEDAGLLREASDSISHANRINTFSLGFTVEMYLETMFEARRNLSQMNTKKRDISRMVNELIIHAQEKGITDELKEKHQKLVTML